MNTEILSLTDGFLETELAGVNERILSTVTSDLPIVDEVLEYAASNRGKRVRPRLVILAHRAAGGDGRKAVAIAAAVEMVHLATLLHDDVIDESDERRGRASANERYGNRVAVLAGDYLYTKVFLDVLAEVDHPEIINLVARVTNEMSIGEFFQMWWQGKLDVTEEEYFRIIEKKSASLMRTAARCGALLAGDNGAVAGALTAYGLNFGLAFQITDDCLDFTGSSGEMGKDELNDVRQGKVTLPLIYGLRTDAGKRLVGLVESFWNGEDHKERVDEILNILERSGALEEAEVTARRYAETAKDRLVEVGPGEAREYLSQLADWSWQRSR